MRRQPVLPLVAIGNGGAAYEYKLRFHCRREVFGCKVANLSQPADNHVNATLSQPSSAIRHNRKRLERLYPMLSATIGDHWILDARNEFGNKGSGKSGCPLRVPC